MKGLPPPGSSLQPPSAPGLLEATGLAAGWARRAETPRAPGLVSSRDGLIVHQAGSPGWAGSLVSLPRAGAAVPRVVEPGLTRWKPVCFCSLLCCVVFYIPVQSNSAVTCLYQLCRESRACSAAPFAVVHNEKFTVVIFFGYSY